MIAAQPNLPAKAWYKIIISLSLGLLGFAVDLRAFHFDFPPYRVDLPVGLVFPMLVSLAWGWRYGLLSATLGLGCQAGWFTRLPQGGWESYVTIPLSSLWVAWHGWCAGRRRHRRYPSLNPYSAEVFFRLGNTLVLYLLAQWAGPKYLTWEMSSDASLGYVNFLAIAQAANAYFVILIADVAFNLGTVRRLFGLRQRPGQITSGYVIGAAALCGLLFWVIDGLVDYYKFREQLRFLIFQAPESILDSIILNISSPDLFARVAFVAVCLTGGLLVSRLLRKQFEGEAALRQSEIRYRRLHETMWDAFVQMDMSGRIVDCNDAYLQMTGYPREQLAGMKEADLTPSRWHQMEAETVRPQVVRCGCSEVYEKEYIRIDGCIFPVELRLFLISNDTSDPIGTWAIVRDITQRKQNELEREKAIADLQKTNADLKQFAYVASHDLQEPLRMVASYTQLLADRYQHQLDDRAHKYIHYAVDGASRMQALIRDLLAFSRVGTLAQEFRKVDTQSALGKAVANLKTMIDETRTLVITDDLPLVQADETQLSLVFQNLIGNAIKFQNRSRIPRIHVSAVRQSGCWRFSVQDNGIGIESRYSEKVFQIFQRLHTREEYPGTGIGLALCKRIVESHGGRIWFESIPREGTTFYFTIPENEKESGNELHAVGKTHRHFVGGG